MDMLEKLFKLKEHNTNVKTEIVAGITTFLSMAYILAVNPSMLAAAGMDQGQYLQPLRFRLHLQHYLWAFWLTTR